jgi:CRP-like cAMP-binding protein
MMFGHGALAGVQVHPADVTADTDVEYYTIGAADIEALVESDPSLAAAVYRNVARDLAAELLLEASEIRALSS